MANQIMLKAEARTEQGSGAARRLRRAGFVPAAINSLDGGTKLLKLNAHAFGSMLRHHTSDHLLINVELDGKVVPALLREVQHDVMDGSAVHADFGEVSLTKKIRINIGLRLVGEPEGVKTEGGILEQTLRQIEVECLPTDMVESFQVDVSALKLGQSLAVRDLKLGDLFTVITGKDVAVATVVAMAAEEVVETAEVAAGATEGAAPEVIAKGKKDEEGAEAGAEGEKAPAADKKAAGEKKPATEKKVEKKK
jgi:large subunit ribosomal protein L25